MKLLFNLINSYSMPVTLILFALTLAYYIFLYNWSKKANDVDNVPSDEPEQPQLPAAIYGYLYHKCYKPRLLMSTIIDWHKNADAVMSVDKDLFFTISPATKDVDPVLSNLFKHQQSITFGKSVITRPLKRASKQLRKMIRRTSKQYLEFQLTPFIVGLFLSVITLTPLILQENVLWFGFFLVLAYINYHALYFLTFYTKEGLKQRKIAENLKKHLLGKKGLTLEDMEVYLPYAVSLDIDENVCKNFRRAYSLKDKPQHTYSALWFVYDYPNYNLGNQLKKSLAYYK